MATETIFIPTITYLRKAGRNAFVFYADDITGTTREYRTNDNGEGLWTNSKQVRGTCQFQITAKTASGIRKQIKRQLSL
jgi:hypothetical protein